MAAVPVLWSAAGHHPAMVAAVICLSPGKGGMELDAVKTARLLDTSCNVVLVIRRGGYIDRAGARLLAGSNVAVEPISFRLNYSPRMAFAVREVLRRHRVADVIYFGASELKSLWLSFLGLDLNVMVRHGTTKTRPKKDLFHRLIYRCVTRHIAISRHLARNVAELYPVQSESDVVLIYPSIAAPPVPDFRAAGDRVRIIHVGRVSHGKGQDAAIRACANLARSGIDFDLTLLGDSPEGASDELERLAARSGIAARVRLMGHVEDVYPHLLSADVFLFPSAGEGFGNALAEALCTGLVPIVYDNSALGEVMRLGFHGHLIADGDEQALAEALVHVCAGIADEKRRAYANVARARVIFSENRERAEYLQLMSGAPRS